MRRGADSMVDRGRTLDNIFVEQLWRSAKYEEVYLKDCASVPDARTGLGSYLAFYKSRCTAGSLRWLAGAGTGC